MVKKILLVSAAVTALGFFAVPANASGVDVNMNVTHSDAPVIEKNSGFGELFAGTPNPALGTSGESNVAANNDATNNDGSGLQKIEPAAGVARESVDQEHIGAEERELGKKFDTDVNRAVIERGTGDVRTHDTMGEGPVGVYLDNSKDSRTHREEDRIGVDVKVLKFD